MKRPMIGALALAGLVACSDGTAPPTTPAPRVLRIDLQTPQADDGAMVITLHGPDVTGIRAASASYLVYARSVASDETRIVVLGDLSEGSLLAVDIKDGHTLAEYAASVEEVATRADVLRADLSGYRLAVTLP